MTLVFISGHWVFDTAASTALVTYFITGTRLFGGGLSHRLKEHTEIGTVALDTLLGHLLFYNVMQKKKKKRPKKLR